MPFIVFGTTQVFGEPKKHSIAVVVHCIGGSCCSGPASLLATLETLFAGEGGQDNDCDVFLASSNFAV